MKKKLLSIIALLTFAFASAQTVGDTFIVGDLAYTVTSVLPNEAEVSDFADAAVASITVPATAIDVTSNAFSTTYSVTAIGEGAFNSNTATKNPGTTPEPGDNVLTTVSLPTSVTTLKAHSFRSLSNLTTINLENIVTLGDSAFLDASSLPATINFPALKDMGQFGIGRANSIENVTFPVLETIGRGFLFDCNNITSVEIPSSVTNIAKDFLQRASGITEVTVNWASPSDVTIDSKNFLEGIPANGDPIYNDITLFVPVGTVDAYKAASPWSGANVTEIGSTPAVIIPAVVVGSTFTEGGNNYKVTALGTPNTVAVTGSSNATVIIPTTITKTDDGSMYDVTSIPESGFSGNTTITSVSLPSAITIIEKNTFLNAINLTTINTENIVEVKENGLRGTGVTSLNLSSLQTTGLNSLSRSASIVTMELPAIVTLGRLNFFENTSMTTLKLGASATTLAFDTFRGVPALTSIEMAAVTPPAFTGGLNLKDGTVPANITVSAPTIASATAYSEDAEWSKFGGFGVTATLSNNVVSQSEFSVYPNPVEDVITIQNVDAASVLIIDITGKVVLSETGNTVDVSSLSSGVYLLKVTADNNTYVKRIVKK